MLLLCPSLSPSLSLSLQAIFPITNIRRLRLWEEYFLRYDFTTFTLRGGRQVEDNMANHSPSVIVSQPKNFLHNILVSSSSETYHIIIPQPEWNFSH